MDLCPCFSSGLESGSTEQSWDAESTHICPILEVHSGPWGQPAHGRDGAVGFVVPSNPIHVMLPEELLPVAMARKTSGKVLE